MDTIDGMRTFAVVVTEGSFTAAARRLNMTTKLASKYVRQLEEKLGAQLLNRTTRSISLTETGRAYFDRCQPLLDQFDELEAIVRDQQTELAGSIRITAPTGYGASHLTTALEPFLTKNPKVTVDLHLTDRRVSIIEEGFDLAIRLSNLEDSSLIAKKVRPMRVVACVAPSYISRHGKPDHPKALASHNCLVSTSAVNGNAWRFHIKGKPLIVKVSGSFSADSPRALAEITRRGLGISLVPLYAVEPWIADGSIQILFEENEASEIGVYALYPSKKHIPARVRALIDYLVSTEISKVY